MSGTAYHKENSWWTSLDFGSSLYHGRRYYCNLLIMSWEVWQFQVTEKKRTLYQAQVAVQDAFYLSHACVFSRFSHVQLFGTQWIVACQTPLSMGFFRQEYWSELSCPPPGDLPNPVIKPVSPALQADSLVLSHQGNPHLCHMSQWY